MKYDFVVIGGGIVGLSTAWQLQQRNPRHKILLLEKENTLARHQTGHNSGVIHAGVYYQPGSLKAKFCKKGLAETISFCKKTGIRYEQCGKLLVATGPLELKRMHALYQRCRENEIDCELLDAARLRDAEPNVNGTGAILVKSTGIVNFREICLEMADRFRTLGGSIRLNTPVRSIDESDSTVTLGTEEGMIRTDFLVSCAGLQADRLVRMHGLKLNFQIIPFRGEYYRLAEHLSGLVKHLIYPVPDPALPFLGVHLTKMIDGSITVGPNAVLGWKREGYGKINFSIFDTAEMCRFGGFWRVLRGNFRAGLNELKNSLWKPGYLREVQKYCPAVTIDDLLPYPAGVRAQAVLSDGSLVHDFLFAESPRSLHVCNAPSPAATSAIPIGEYLCGKIAEKRA